MSGTDHSRYSFRPAASAQATHSPVAEMQLPVRLRPPLGLADHTQRKAQTVVSDGDMQGTPGRRLCAWVSFFFFRWCVRRRGGSCSDVGMTYSRPDPKEGPSGTTSVPIYYNLVPNVRITFHGSKTGSKMQIITTLLRSPPTSAGVPIGTE